VMSESPELSLKKHSRDIRKLSDARSASHLLIYSQGAVER